VIEQATDNDFHLWLGHRQIELPNILFSLTSDRWLRKSSLPALPLVTWDSRHSGLSPTLVEPTIPVIYGCTERPAAVGDDYIYLPIDIFGAVFFMLSRYEEAVCLARDEHDRFPAKASLAYRAGFIDRPIVDEYLSILWSALTRLWPSLERKQQHARTLISCDIDSPFDPACASLFRMGKRMLGRSWRDKSFDRLPMIVNNYLAVKQGDYSLDPYRSAIDWIMDVNENAGNQVAFYFICEQTDAKMDTAVSVDEPRMRAIMRSIHARGHEIGIHPGYDTYKNPVKFAQSVSKLRHIMEVEGIKQDVLGGRQHYLRWETPTTAQLWEANGLTYDSTLTYADRAGFRCGTCHEYRMFDLINRKPLNLLQRPLVVMESTIIDMQCMGLGYGNEARELIYRYKRICHQFNGDFTLLWHNSYFEHRAAKEMCSDVISAPVQAVPNAARSAIASLT
jgi:hypothetical protein